MPAPQPNSIAARPKDTTGRDDGPMPDQEATALARNFQDLTPPVGTVVTQMVVPRQQPVVLDKRDGRFLWMRPLDDGEESPAEPVTIQPGDIVVPFQPIHSTGLNTNDMVGDRTGFVLGIPIVEVSRDDEERVVVARSRLLDEPESERVRLPFGYTLTLPPGAITIELERIDQMFESDEDGYKPLSNTIWTWMAIGPPPGTEELARYLLAAARRLDTSYRGFVRVRHALEALEETMPGPLARLAVFEIVGDIEVAVVALGRVVDMAVDVGRITKAPVAHPGPSCGDEARSDRDSQCLRAHRRQSSRTRPTASTS